MSGGGGDMPFAFGDHMKTFNQYVNELRKAHAPYTSCMGPAVCCMIPQKADN